MSREEKSNFQLLVDAGVIPDLDQLRANLTAILDTFTPEEITQIIELATSMQQRSQRQFTLGVAPPNIPGFPPARLRSKGAKPKARKPKS